jgi:DNA-binding transcriptional regulator YiaG
VRTPRPHWVGPGPDPQSNRSKKRAERLARSATKNLGVVKIRALVDVWSIGSIARLCGVSVSRVCAWTLGDDVPQTERAHEMLAEVGLQRDDWRAPAAAAPSRFYR